MIAGCEVQRMGSPERQILPSFHTGCSTGHYLYSSCHHGNATCCYLQQASVSADHTRAAMKPTKPHTVPGEHLYNGILYNRSVTPESLQKAAAFEVREDDCFICGYPKSGTTWLQEMVCAIFANGEVDQLKEKPTFMRVPFLENYQGSIEMLQKMTPPRLAKSHLPYEMLPTNKNQNNPKILYIMRNPKDVSVSYYHFYRMYRELGNYKGGWNEFFQMFSSGHVVYGNWFTYIKGWWEKKDLPHVKLIRYEEMRKDPYRAVQEVARFLQQDLSNDAIEKIVQYTSFESMRENPATNFTGAPQLLRTDISPFIRKGKVGDWKNYYTEEQSSLIDKLVEIHLGDLDLEFDYD